MLQATQESIPQQVGSVTKWSTGVLDPSSPFLPVPGDDGLAQP